MLRLAWILKSQTIVILDKYNKQHKKYINLATKRKLKGKSKIIGGLRLLFLWNL